MAQFMTDRRWLRFSVRTLLVAVTIFCLWLGWNWQIVQHRKSVGKRIWERSIIVGSSSVHDLILGGRPRLSWIREQMGDHFVMSIHYWDLEESELQEVKKAFPEATVIEAEPHRREGIEQIRDGR